ncbi:hypothetical protein [Nostoc phage N1]|nr:hypothetical protein [Nostoc phage N1]
MRFWKTLQNFCEYVRFKLLSKPCSVLGLKIVRQYSGIFGNYYYQIYKGDEKVLLGNINVVEEYIRISKKLYEHN